MARISNNVAHDLHRGKGATQLNASSVNKLRSIDYSEINRKAYLTCTHAATGKGPPVRSTCVSWNNPKSMGRIMVLIIIAAACSGMKY